MTVVAHTNSPTLLCYEKPLIHSITTPLDSVWVLASGTTVFNEFEFVLLSFRLPSTAQEAPQVKLNLALSKVWADVSPLPPPPLESGVKRTDKEESRL